MVMMAINHLFESHLALEPFHGQIRPHAPQCPARRRPRLLRATRAHGQPLRPGRGRTRGQDGSQKVYDALAEIPELTECHRVTGDPCVIMQAAVGSMPELESLINRIAKFGFSKTSIILSSAIERRVPLGQLEGNGKSGG